MHRLTLAGGALALVALAGYVAGIAAPYPGRAFAVTGVMLGIALLVIGLGLDAGEGAVR